MNIWPDSQLLCFASSFAKKFNWLTGKDNFWLSYQLILAGGVIFTFNSYIRTYNVVNTILVGSMTLAFILLIKMIEELRTRFSDTKIIEIELMFLMIRLAFLVSSLLAISALLFMQTSLKTNAIFVLAWSICWTLSLYLASIDKPPFSDSKVWEWLKDMIQIQSIELKPIPINSR